MMRAMSDIPTDLPESTPPKAQRCAVYTRVSMDNSEDDKLSSVQAQFMACHELIASQFGMQRVGRVGERIRKRRVKRAGYWQKWLSP